MKLLIVSFMPHHIRDGQIVGWGPTVRELDHLATRFDKIRHVATLYDDEAPSSALPYQAKNIELVPVRPSGAPGLLGKFDALRRSPGYVRTILQEMRSADMVHVRAPASIALLAMLLLAAKRAPSARWIKYAGNWKPNGPESPSYTFQRWWLSRPLHGGIVTVNGHWPDQPSWVRTFYNPSLEDEDLARGATIAAAKRMSKPLRALFVGRVEVPKGARRAIDIVTELHTKGVDVELDIVGDGPEKATYQALVAERGLSHAIRFLGWLPHTKMGDVYANAHVLLLPTSASEGWPKVLSEGMAFGVVPVAGAVSSIPQYLDELGCGRAIDPGDLRRFVAALQTYSEQPELWRAESQRAVAGARWFTFSHYLKSIDKLMADLGVGDRAS